LKNINRKLTYWLRKRITDRVKEISLEKGFRVGFVYPGWTSMQCLTSVFSTYPTF